MLVAAASRVHSLNLFRSFIVHPTSSVVVPNCAVIVVVFHFFLDIVFMPAGSPELPTVFLGCASWCPLIFYIVLKHLHLIAGPQYSLACSYYNFCRGTETFCICFGF